MSVNPKLQLTIDCAEPERLAAFWAAALGYMVEPPPAPFSTWRAYWLAQGLSEEELGAGDCGDSVIDPQGVGPRIWFQQVPDGKRERATIASEQRKRRIQAGMSAQSSLMILHSIT